MRVDVQFVNFPKSHFLQDIVSRKVRDCFQKFYAQPIFVKMFLSADGLGYQIKIAVKSPDLAACISASTTNMRQTIEKGLQKLEVFVKRSSSRQKSKRSLNYGPNGMYYGELSVGSLPSIPQSGASPTLQGFQSRDL